MAANVLGGLASSRLDNAAGARQEDRVRVSADVIAMSASASSRRSDGKPGVDPALVGKQVDAILADFIKNGPTAEELKRAKTSDIASTIRGLDSVGGFGGKAVTLRRAPCSRTTPASTRRSWRRRRRSTPAEVQAAANKWLSRPVFAFTLAPGKRDPYEESKLAGDTAGGAAGSQGHCGAQVRGRDHHQPVSIPRRCRRRRRSPTSTSRPSSTPPCRTAFPCCSRTSRRSGGPRRNRLRRGQCRPIRRPRSARRPSCSACSTRAPTNIIRSRSPGPRKSRRDDFGLSEHGPVDRLFVRAHAQSSAVARPDGGHRPAPGVRSGRGRPRARPAARAIAEEAKQPVGIALRTPAADPLRQGSSLRRAVHRKRRSCRGRQVHALRPHRLPL